MACRMDMAARCFRGVVSFLLPDLSVFAGRTAQADGHFILWPTLPPHFFGQDEVVKIPTFAEDSGAVNIGLLSERVLPAGEAFGRETTPKFSYTQKIKITSSGS
jgi:hypothetical protein